MGGRGKERAERWAAARELRQRGALEEAVGRVHSDGREIASPLLLYREGASHTNARRRGSIKLARRMQSAQLARRPRVDMLAGVCVAAHRDEA